MSKKRSEVEREMIREVNQEKWSAWNAVEVFLEWNWKILEEILESLENMEGREERMEEREERMEERMEEGSLKKECISILEKVMYRRR